MEIKQDNEINVFNTKMMELAYLTYSTGEERGGGGGGGAKGDRRISISPCLERLLLPLDLLRF